MKFILSRVDDARTHSKGWILRYALLFWLATRIIGVLLNVVCCVGYEAMGIHPETLTKFGGDPSAAKGMGELWFVVLAVMVVAPFIEEAVFRLGLSFKRRHVALCLAALPLFGYWSCHARIAWYYCAVALTVAVVIYMCVYRFTSDEFWSRCRKRWLVPAIYITSIAFGLIHVMAFSVVSVELLPYIFCVILIPFFAGCACAYLRVNLGFRCGLAMHVFNNLPALFVLCMS